MIARASRMVTAGAVLLFLGTVTASYAENARLLVPDNNLLSGTSKILVPSVYAAPDGSNFTDPALVIPKDKVQAQLPAESCVPRSRRVNATTYSSKAAQAKTGGVLPRKHPLPPMMQGAPRSNVLSRNITPVLTNSSVKVGVDWGWVRQGLDNLDNAAAGYSETFPSDMAICVGKGFIVQIVNYVMTVRDMNGGTLIKWLSIPNMLDPTSGQVFDPRCLYDATTQRFFIVMASRYSAKGPMLHLAVTETSDPTQFWNVYSINGLAVEYPSCKITARDFCWSDFPTIGSDDYGFWVAANVFTNANNTFIGPLLVVLSKEDLVAGKNCSISFSYAGEIESGFANLLPSNVQPNSVNTTGNTTYILYNPAPTGNTCLLNATQTDLLVQGQAPKLSNCIRIQTFLFTVPQQAVQANNQSLSSSLRGFPGSSLTYMNGKLYTMGPTGVTSGDGFSSDLSALAWFVLDPQNAQLYKGGTIAVNDTDLFMGAVAATSGGNIVFTCLATNRTTPGFFSIRGLINVAQGAVSDMFYFKGDDGNIPVNVVPATNFTNVGDYSAIVAGDNGLFYGSSQTTKSLTPGGQPAFSDWGSVIWGGLRAP
eukprot:jgi/Botrbrau1/11680/Bobra.0195s0011.1